VIHSSSILYSVNIFILFKRPFKVCKLCRENHCDAGDNLVMLMFNFQFGQKQLMTLFNFVYKEIINVTTFLSFL